MYSKNSILLVTTLSLTAGLTTACQDQPKENEKKNIILVMADDLGYGDLGVYGQEKIKTPNLDRMASEGIMFTNFYSGSTVCAPSRCVLMTGKDTGNAYLRNNTTTPLRTQDTIITQILKKEGYVTGMFGKWGLGEPGTSGDPVKKGFDAFTGYTNQVEAHFYYLDTIERIVDGRIKRIPIDNNTYNHEIEVNDAFQFIRNNKDTTFFAYLPIRLPHAELIAPEEDMKKYLNENGESIFEEIPFKSDGHFDDQSMPFAAYAAMVSKLDKDMGRLMQLLEDEGLVDNTIVLFTSDNGADNTAGKLPVFDSNAPFRGKKRDLYEGGIRVPMIAWGTSDLPKSQTHDLMWAMWDIPATLADFAGTTFTAEHDGISVYNTLTGKEQTEKHQHLYFEFAVSWLNRYIQSVRKDNWKLLRIKDNIDPAVFELYNLGNDPGETNNLADAHPQIVEDLKFIMDQEHSTPEREEFDYTMPTGYKIPDELFINEQGEPGALTGHYYQGVNFENHVFQRDDKDITFAWGYDSPGQLPDDGFSIRWKGMLQIEKPGTYTFYTANDDGVRLYIDDELVIDDWNSHGVEIHSGKISIDQTGAIPVIFEYFENVGGAEVKLRWSEMQ